MSSTKSSRADTIAAYIDEHRRRNESAQEEQEGRQPSRIPTRPPPVDPARIRMDMVLDAIEQRGEPPFIDVREVIDHMGESGLTDFDISIAVLRLICNRQLHLAADGIRPI